MMLCVDVGNSLVKAAWVVDGEVGRVVRVESAAAPAALAAAVRRAAGRGRRPCRAAMVSVFPRANPAVVSALTRACGRAPLVVDHRTAVPLRIAVKRRSSLGPDRVCAAVGALGRRRRSCVIVSVGTAITVDLVTDRVFRGGVILPGPGLALASLHAHTARLPRLDFGSGAFPPAGIDRTDLAMKWGAGLAAAGGIREAVAMLEKRAGRRLRVVVTGGASARLRPLLPERFDYRPDRVLVGLEIIAGRQPDRHL